MDVKLTNIAGVDRNPHDHWSIKALLIGDKSLAIDGLDLIRQHNKSDWKKLLKVMRMQAASKDRLQDEKKIKKSSNKNHGDVYEMRADKGNSRLMFFFSEEEEAIIVCTNTFSKGKGKQDTAFALCANLKNRYESRNK